MKGILWILVVLIIGIVGYLAFTQGYFTGKEEAGTGLEINLGETE